MTRPPVAPRLLPAPFAPFNARVNGDDVIVLPEAMRRECALLLVEDGANPAAALAFAGFDPVRDGGVLEGGGPVWTMPHDAATWREGMA